MIGLIWAQAARRVIGRDNAIPWRLPEDLAHFRAVTSGGAVLMGRRTWDSLPDRFRPLPGRRNLVLTRDRAWSAAGAEVVHDVAAVLDGADELWVIGGAAVYAAALPRADVVELTEVDLAVAGDVHAPELGPDWRCAARDPASGWHTSRTCLRYRWSRWVRCRAQTGTSTTTGA